jgi:hypothetical protein
MNQIEARPSKEASGISLRQRLLDKFFSHPKRYSEVYKGSAVSSLQDSRLAIIADKVHRDKKAMRTTGALIRTLSSSNKHVLLLMEAIENGQQATSSDRIRLEGKFGRFPNTLQIQGWDNKQAYNAIAQRFRLGLPYPASGAHQENVQREQSLMESIQRNWNDYDRIIVFSGNAHIKNLMPHLVSSQFADTMTIVNTEVSLMKRTFPKLFRKRYTETVRKRLTKGAKGFSIED